jgi:hypothetical protein
MFKIFLVYFFLFSLFDLCAQSCTIDTNKIKQKIPFSLLSDTSILQGKIKVTKGDSNFDINNFLRNSTHNKPAVHISSSGVYYYNSLAVSLMFRDKKKMFNKGLEFLNREDYKSCFKINNVEYNSFNLNCYNPKIISEVPLGQIIDNGENNKDNSIDFNSLIFRIAEFSNDSYNEEYRFGSTKLMMIDDNKRFTSYEGMGYSFNGIPVIVKQTFDYFLFNNKHSYFDIMPVQIYTDLKNFIFESVKNSKITGINNSYSFQINGEFNQNQKIDIIGDQLNSSSFDFISKKLNEYCPVPIYNYKSIISHYKISTQVRSSFSRESQSTYNQLNKNFPVINFYEISSFVKKNNLEREEIKYNKINVDVKINDTTYPKYRYLNFSSFKLPSYNVVFSSFLGFGKKDLFYNTSNIRWLTPSFSIGSLTTSLTTYFLSKVLYQSYLNSIPNNNDFRKYNYANTIHKINLISTGIYALITSVNIYLNMKDVKLRRKTIYRVNREFKNKYPNGLRYEYL